MRNQDPLFQTMSIAVTVRGTGGWELRRIGRRRDMGGRRGKGGKREF